MIGVHKTSSTVALIVVIDFCLLSGLKIIGQDAVTNIIALIAYHVNRLRKCENTLHSYFKVFPYYVSSFYTGQRQH